MTACDPAFAALTSTSDDGPVAANVVNVDGIPMSGLLAEARDPRAVIVALHGGAAKASYFDCPKRPWLSLLRTAVAVGFTVLALDRPGYGASHWYAGTMTTPARRVDLAYAAVCEHLGARPRGAGVFVLAHSIGCELAIRMAADGRGAGLLGLELAGTGRRHHAAALETMTAWQEDPKWPKKPTGLRRLLWQPAHLYPDEILGGAGIGARSPAYEAGVVKTWTTDFPKLAARVRVPVRYTLGEDERVWQSGPAGLADIAALFAASPRVEVNEQAHSGHNLSVGHSAAAYHLGLLSYVEECALARENVTRNDERTR